MNPTDFINALTDGKRLMNTNIHMIIALNSYAIIDYLNVVTTDMTATFESKDFAFAISPDGEKVIVFDKNVRIMEIKPNKFVVME